MKILFVRIHRETIMGENCGNIVGEDSPLEILWVKIHRLRYYG